MGYVVRMPKLGMTMETGEIVEWVVDEGEPFDEGDVILLVESEKTTNDIHAQEAGVILARYVDSLEPVEPGTPVAYVGQEDEDAPAVSDLERAGQTAESDESTAETERDRGTNGEGADARGKVSPRARSYARTHGVSADAFQQIDGSGPGGAVIEQDVVDHAASATAASTSAPGLDVVGDSTGRDIYEEVEQTGVRKTIARQMTASARDVPQVTLNRRVSVAALEQIKNRLATDVDTEVSVIDFVIAVVADALGDHPRFNAIYDDGHKIAGNVNVGIAVDTEAGLITPVLKGADRRTLQELSDERRRLVQLAQDREFTADDLEHGTFTITNLGHFEIDSFDPILNPPEVGILGVGSITEASDEREIGLSLTFDHRAVDGADAARFLDSIADGLTHPLRLLSLGSDLGVRQSAVGGTKDRVVSADSSGEMAATVTTRGFEWRADEPEEKGGSNSAPTPVEQFLGSLSSCLAITIRHIAERRGVSLNDVHVTVSGEPDSGSLERLDVDVTVENNEDDEGVQRVVETAKRACFVSQAIDGDVETSMSISQR